MERTKLEFSNATGVVVQTPETNNPCGYIKLSTPIPVAAKRMLLYVIYLEESVTLSVGDELKFEVHESLLTVDKKPAPSDDLTIFVATNIKKK